MLVNELAATLAAADLELLISAAREVVENSLPSRYNPHVSTVYTRRLVLLRAALVSAGALVEEEAE